MRVFSEGSDPFGFFQYCDQLMVGQKEKPMICVSLEFQEIVENLIDFFQLILTIFK